MKQSKRSGLLVCFIFEETREGLRDCSFSVEVIIFNVVLFPFFFFLKRCAHLLWVLAIKQHAFTVTVRTKDKIQPEMVGSRVIQTHSHLHLCTST